MSIEKRAAAVARLAGGRDALFRLEVRVDEPEAVPVGAAPPTGTAPHPRPRGRLAWFVAILLTWLVGRFAVRTLVVEPYVNPSAAMIPTLVVGEHLVVSKTAYGPRLPFDAGRVASSLPPKRGDVMVFEVPESRAEHFVQRVVGASGDTIEVHHGRLFVNEKMVPRCLVGRSSYTDVWNDAGPSSARTTSVEGDVFVEFLDDHSFLTFQALDPVVSSDGGPWTVKPGEVFVLGDNRSRSRDSRAWWGGKGGGVPYDAIVGRVTTIWGSSDPSRSFFASIEKPTLPAAMKALQPQLDACLGPKPPLEPAP